MENGNKLLQKGLELPAAPKLSDYYDDRFLPDASELKMI
jgi:hypothetical protein